MTRRRADRDGRLLEGARPFAQKLGRPPSTHATISSVLAMLALLPKPEEDCPVCGGECPLHTLATALHGWAPGSPDAHPVGIAIDQPSPLGLITYLSSLSGEGLFTLVEDLAAVLEEVPELATRIAASFDFLAERLRASVTGAGGA